MPSTARPDSGGGRPHTVLARFTVPTKCGRARSSIPREICETRAEQSLRRLAIRHGQFPSSPDKGRIGGDGLESSSFPISRPSPWYVRRERSRVACQPEVFLRAKKCQIRRVPLTCHEAVKVLMVPGGLLPLKQLLDGRFLGVRCQGEEKDQHRNEDPHAVLLGEVSHRVRRECLDASGGCSW